jgi:signal transduction histidine kinase
VVFLFSTALLASAIGFEVRSSIRETTLRAVGGQLAVHKRALESRGTAGLEELTRAPRLATESLVVRLMEADGTTSFEYQSASPVGLERGRLPAAQGAPSYQSVEGAGGATWGVGTTPLADGRFLQLALHDESTERVLTGLRTGLVAMWLAAIALGLLGGFLLTRLSMKPIHRLAAIVRQVIASGDQQLRVPETGLDDDLRELSRLFNTMLTRNEALMRGMREALDNVAHDLRTPLTRLRTGAEVALSESVDATAARGALANVIEESDEALAMLTSLMDITDAETGVMRLTLADIDLGALVRDCLDLYADVAEERGVRVVQRLEAGLQVRGDRLRLQQAIANLLDNALKYTRVGGLVEVETRREGDWALVVVQDNGSGISASDLPRIWTRLFRGDSSRSQPGLGLGLSLVKAIIEAHHGRVEAQSPGVGLGTTFTLRLPWGLPVRKG